MAIVSRGSILSSRFCIYRDETSLSLNKNNIISRGPKAVVSRTDPNKKTISLGGSSPTKKEWELNISKRV